MDWLDDHTYRIDDLRIHVNDELTPMRQAWADFDAALRNLGRVLLDSWEPVLRRVGRWLHLL